MTRRDFVQTLGGGILVMLVEEDILAQESGGGSRRRAGDFGSAPQDVNAWLHIGEDGVVTVYTGKVEVGQNARTSLTQAAAEELVTWPARAQIRLRNGRYGSYAGGYGHGGEYDYTCA